jgi:hypothetical protein
MPAEVHEGNRGKRILTELSLGDPDLSSMKTAPAHRTRAVELNVEIAPSRLFW